MTKSSVSLVSAEVRSLADERASIGRRQLHRSAREVAETAFARAGNYDEDGAYPSADIAALNELGLLTAALPAEWGGMGLTGLPLSEILRTIGSGSLPLGRLFEGHVNALELVRRYGNYQQVALVGEEARAGKLFGVWNTDDATGLRLARGHGRFWLEGRKVLASGAGHIERPLVTATDETGGRLMVLPKVNAVARADLSGWRAQGMRASATGAVDFTGVEIEPIEIVGNEGDYERQPWFSVGAWRFAAVHLGGMERLFDLLRRHLQDDQPRKGSAPGGASRARPLWPSKRRGSGSPRQHDQRGPFGIESAGAARRLRQSRAPCGGGCGPRSHAACPSLGRASGFPAAESDRTHIARPRHLSSPARPGSRASGRGGVDTREALGRAGSVAMTAGELLDSAHSFQFRPLREQLGRSAICRCRAASRRREPGLRRSDRRRLPTGIARNGRHRQRRRWLASEQQSLSAGPTEICPRGRGKASGSGAWARAGRDSLPQPPRSICPP